MTTDGKFVASHDWSQFESETKRNEMASQDMTMLELCDVVRLMYNYDDIQLVFDVLGICKGYPSSAADEQYRKFYIALDGYINAADVALYDRIILEILPNDSTAMFEYAKTYSGLKNFSYAEYYGSSHPMIDDESFRRVGEYCQSNDIKYISISGNLTKQRVEILHSYGVYVMTFTYNNPIKMYELFDMSIDCIFTDFSFM